MLLLLIFITSASFPIMESMSASVALVDSFANYSTVSPYDDHPLVIKTSERSKNIIRITVGILMTSAIMCIMTNSGINLEKRQLWNVIKRPIGPIIGFLCQFLVLPFITLGVCRAMEVDKQTMMSALINSCCPGGVMSNFLTHITKGDVALSVTMSFLSTVCAFFMMPLSLWVFSSMLFVGTKIEPPYIHIAISLASLIIPVLIGAIGNQYKKVWAYNFKRYSKIWIVLTLLTSGILFAILYPSIYFVGNEIIISGLLVALAGFFFGYSISKIVRLSEVQCRAVCFETGFQNVAISFAVIQFSFPDNSDEMFAFPLWYATGVGAYSSVFVVSYILYQRWDKYRNPDSQPQTKGCHKKINSQTVQLVDTAELDEEDELRDEFLVPNTNRANNLLTEIGQPDIVVSVTKHSKSVTL